jgi:hypothetical protein
VPIFSPELHKQPSYPAKAGYPVRCGRSTPSLMSRNTGSSAFADDDGWGCGRTTRLGVWRVRAQPIITDSNFKQQHSCSHSYAISPRNRASFAVNVLPPEYQRARGMPGARCARSRAWSVVNTRVSHHGHTGITRHSPRSGFNGFLRTLPGDRAFLPPSSAKIASANLTPASGRQDHTTSPSARSALSSLAPPASTASRAQRP